MELRHYLLLLRRRLALIVACVVAGVVGGYVVGHHSPQYQAQTSIYVGSRTNSDTSANDIVSLDRIIATYSAMVKSSPVAAGAIAASHAARGPGQVVSETSANVVTNTNLIEITVRDSNPQVAQALANGVAVSFIAQVESLSVQSGVSSTTAPSVSVFQQATAPGSLIPTSKKRDLALGALFGLVVAVGLALLLDYLDVSVKSAEDLELRSGLPVLGSIPLGRPGSTAPFPSTS